MTKRDVIRDAVSHTEPEPMSLVSKPTILVVDSGDTFVTKDIVHHLNTSATAVFAPLHHLEPSDVSDKATQALLMSPESPLPYPVIDPDKSHYSRRDRYILKKERKAIKKSDPKKRWRT